MPPRWLAKFKKSDFFPKLDRGFWADLTSSTEQLRLFVHIHEIRWAASVYNKRTKEWITESSVAKDPDEAKRKAEQIARHLMPGAYDIEWRSIGGYRS
jgi:phage gp46-like protein